MKTSNKLLLGLLGFVLVLFTSVAIYARLHFKSDAITGEGNQTERVLPTSAFTKLRIEGPLHVFIAEGASPQITVKGYENLLQEIETQNVNGELTLRLKKKIGMAEDLEVHLVVKDLEELGLWGGTRVETVTPLKGNGLKITGEGGVNAELELFYNELICESSAGSQMELRGAVPKAAFAFESGSQLDASDLRVNSCMVKGESGASGEVNVSQELSADLESGASLEYSGTTVLKDIKTESGGSVNRK